MRRTYKEFEGMWEDAAANSVAGGGVSMPSDAMGKQALLRRNKKAKLYDGRTGEKFDKETFALQYAHPHNIYLSNLVDRGILGLIIFLIFMFIWLITLFNSYKKYNQDSKAMLFIMGSFSAWTAIFGIGFVNTTFHHENALLALFFLSLHLNYLRQKNQLKLFK